MKTGNGAELQSSNSLEDRKGVDETRHASELIDQVKAMDSASRLLLQVVEIREEQPSSGCSNLTGADAEKTFENMQKKWKLEQTGFPSLFSACKMLQQSRHRLAQEADHALVEMRLAQGVSAAAEKRTHKSKKALRVIWKENGELKKENAKLKKIIRQMSKEQGKQLDDVYAMMAHQEAMSPARSRCSDTESSSVSSALLTPSPSKSFDDDDSLQFSPPSRNNDENNFPELTSPPRINNRSATIYFEDATPGVGDLIARWMNKQDQQRGAYKITFSNSKEIGLKLHSMPIRPSPFGVGKEAGDNAPRAPLVGLQIDFQKLLRIHPEAFIVWGFREVDTCCSDDRPTIGARLIAVDGSPCERGQWGTLHELCRRVRTKRGPVTLTFRNDSVTKEQIDHLNRTLTPRLKGETAKNSLPTVDLMQSPEKRELFRVA